MKQKHKTQFKCVFRKHRTYKECFYSIFIYVTLCYKLEKDEPK